MDTTRSENHHQLGLGETRNVRGFDQWSFYTWRSWLCPFLGQFAALCLLLGLSFNLFVKVMSSWLNSSSIMLLEGFPCLHWKLFPESPWTRHWRPTQTFPNAWLLLEHHRYPARVISKRLGPQITPVHLKETTEGETFTRRFRLSLFLCQ